MPSLRTCVKSLDTIERFPPWCKAPSILQPTQPVPNVVTFCMYGERCLIHALLSYGPNPGSKLVYAPAVGRFVPYALTVLNEPVKPLVVMLRRPVALRT